MGYVRITIQLRNGGTRTGVRRFPEPIIMNDIRKHAWQLSAEVLGRGAIADVTVVEVPASDPAVVALILSNHARAKPIPKSSGEHPYVTQQQRKPGR
jgi:hypothetical protein